MSLGFRVFNLVGFQAVWFASAFGAGSGRPWLGPAVLALYAAGHFAMTPSRGRDLRMLALAIPLGVLVDSAFVMAGGLVYASPGPLPELAPVWIVGMWVGFALTLRHSMGFLADRPAWAAAFGLLGGPLAYAGAARAFDAVAVTASPVAVFAALGVAWGLAMPLMYAAESAWTRRTKGAGAMA